MISAENVTVLLCSFSKEYIPDVDSEITILVLKKI